MKFILFLISGAIFIVLLVVGLFAELKFNQNCGGYLMRAANANTVEMAKKELQKALEYIEKRNLTSGNSSILWAVPSNDIGYWYENIKASNAELESLPPDSSALEKTNVLMKLRETLTDNGERGTKLTVPDSLSVYPHHIIFAILFWGSLVFVSFFFLSITTEK